MTDDELDVLIRDHYAEMEPPRDLTRRLLPPRRRPEGWMVGLAIAAVLALAARPMVGAWWSSPDPNGVASAVPEGTPSRDFAWWQARVPPDHRAVALTIFATPGWPRAEDVVELYERGSLAALGLQGKAILSPAGGASARQEVTLALPTERLGQVLEEEVAMSPAVAVIRSNGLREVLLPWPPEMRPLPRGQSVTVGPGGVSSEPDPSATDQVRARILDHPRPDRVLVEVSAADAPRALRLVDQ